MKKTILVILLVVAAVAAVIYLVRREPQEESQGPVTGDTVIDSGKVLSVNSDYYLRVN